MMRSATLIILACLAAAQAARADDYVTQALRRDGTPFLVEHRADAAAAANGLAGSSERPAAKAGAPAGRPADTARPAEAGAPSFPM